MIGIVNVLITLLIVAAIVAILWYAFKQLPLPPLAQTVATVIICILLAVFLLSLLTGTYQWPVLIRG